MSKALENDEFLEALKLLFKDNRAKGPVVLTMKRYDGKAKHTPKKQKDVPAPTEYMCLLRAYANNKKRKISTVVHQNEVTKFQVAYCALLRASMDGLKKSKKIKKTKA